MRCGCELDYARGGGGSGADDRDSGCAVTVTTGEGLPGAPVIGEDSAMIPVAAHGDSVRQPDRFAGSSQGRGRCASSDGISIPAIPPSAAAVAAAVEGPLGVTHVIPPAPSATWKAMRDESSVAIRDRVMFFRR